MRVDANRSRYHEASSAPHDFNDVELKRCRVMLRRLRFLEQKARETRDDPVDTSGGQMFVEREVDALEWLLVELGYLDVTSAV